jgi:hypothetical protein
MRWSVATLLSAMSFAPMALAQTASPDGRCGWEGALFSRENKGNVLGRWDFVAQCFNGRITGNPTMQALFNARVSAVDAWVDDQTRPLYPSFIKIDNSTYWTAPVRGGVEVEVNGHFPPVPRVVSICSRHPEPFPTYLFLCAGGCAKGDQLTLFADGYHRLSDAMQYDARDIVALDAETSVIAPDGSADLRLRQARVERYTRDALRDAPNEVVVIRTAEGGELTVTLEHPLIDGSGKMVRAKDLAPGDTLLHVSGRRHTVATTRRETLAERVYNLDVTAREETSQVFVVQGYLSGTNRQQRSELEDVNRVLFREQLSSLVDLNADDPRE